jgi:hypothetical protein
VRTEYTTILGLNAALGLNDVSQLPERRSKMHAAISKNSLLIAIHGGLRDQRSPSAGSQPEAVDALAQIYDFAGGVKRDFSRLTQGEIGILPPAR